MAQLCHLVIPFFPETIMPLAERQSFILWINIIIIASRKQEARVKLLAEF